MRVSFTPEAAQEFSEAARWYLGEAGVNQARDFRNQVHRTLQLLSEHPAVGTPGRNRTRSLVVHRYPFSVVYRMQEDDLRIIAVARHSRRPGYWDGRR